MKRNLIAAFLFAPKFAPQIGEIKTSSVMNAVIIKAWDWDKY
jgi:hypothetical protein